MGSDDRSLKERAEDKLNSGNASQLGDPVSLKAETSDNIPTKDEEGAPKSTPDTNARQGTNRSQLGDHTSLKAETSDTNPTEDDKGAKNNRDSKL